MAWVKCGAGGKGGNYTRFAIPGVVGDERIDNETGSITTKDVEYWYTTDPIDVGDRSVIYFISNLDMTYMGRTYGAVYDENDNFISSIAGSFQMLLPAGTRYVRVSCFVPDPDEHPWNFEIIGEVR